MQNGSTATVALACVPSAIPSTERPAHFALIQRLFGSVLEEQEVLPDGYQFRFPPDAFESVARFVANERKCCPFLHFSLEVLAGEGPLWLRIAGPEGTPEFLAAELPI